MQKYVVGFIFDSNLEHVLLIHKDRPDWQKGKFNGLGGKIEEGEDSFSSIAREIKEECDLSTDKDKWVLVGKIISDRADVDVFGYVYGGAMSDAKTMETEEVKWFPIKNLPTNTLNNIPWLVAITLDKIKNQDFESFEIKYKFP